MRTLLGAVVLSAAAVSATLPTFPQYKQCDPRWATDEMGVKGPGERATICKEGCAMTSVSMALAGLGVELNGKAATPRTVNTWLEANDGYTCIAGDCNNLVLAAPGRIPGSPLSFVSEASKPDLEAMRKMVTAGESVIIAHVHNNGHFVLVTGLDPASPGSFAVHDPFYAAVTYPYANISDVILYDIKPSALRGRAAVDLQDAAGDVIIPYPMPLYKQCDSRWGSNKIDTDTICQVGCLMSSTSMALAGHRIDVSGAEANPGTLNAWLRTHGGYTGNDLIESAVPAVDPSRVSWPSDAMHRTNDISIAKVQAMLRAGRPVIANVMHGEHFVLVTGWNASNPDALAVNDPGFTRSFYSHSSDVVGWRLFDMAFA